MTTKKKPATREAENSQTRHQVQIIGHTEQRAFFQELFRRQRLPSTLLLAGPGGVGKRLVARELAQSLFCEKGVWGGCQECHPCSLFAHSSLPDLYSIDLASDVAGSVDGMRELLYSLQLRSFGGKNRVVLIDNAHLMSVQVTNLLLKTLEEPRPDTYFIMISSSKARMLPTLLSRSQVTHFESLSHQEMLRIVQQTPDLIPAEVPASEYALIVQLSDGSFENLASLCHELPRAREISGRIDRIIEGDIPEATRLAAEIAKEKDRANDMLRLLTVLMRTKLHTAKAGEQQHRIAVALHNCVSAERLVFERNLSAGYLLSLMMTQLLPKSGRAGVEPWLIEQVVV